MKPCPCGETPKKIVIEGDDRAKWARCYGDCCGEWIVEYRNNYNRIPSDEAQTLAEQAWNDAPRYALPEPMRDEPQDKEEYFIVDIRKNRIDRNFKQGPFFFFDCRDHINAGLSHTTREAAQAWLDWWNQAVGRKA